MAVDSQEHSACGDPGFEQSLLTPQAQTKWRGSPIAWIEANPHTVQADLTTERNGLVMIDAGATLADFRYGGRAMSWQFTPGSIGFFAAGTELKSSRWRWTVTRRIYLDLDGAVAGNTALLGSLPQLPRQSEIEFRDEELGSVLRTMVEEAAAGCPHGPLFAESLSVGVAMRLHQRAASRYHGSRERGKLTTSQLERVRALVHSRPSGNVSLADLAAAAGYSTPQFVRLFRNTLGCTPYQYVVRVRLQRAKELVMDSDMPLAMIAGETGFASQSHMTAAFVRAFHTPPGEMRRRLRT